MSKSPLVAPVLGAALVAVEALWVSVGALAAVAERLEGFVVGSARLAREFEAGFVGRSCEERAVGRAVVWEEEVVGCELA